MFAEMLLEFSTSISDVFVKVVYCKEKMDPIFMQSLTFKMNICASFVDVDRSLRLVLIWPLEGCSAGPVTIGRSHSKSSTLGSGTSKSPSRMRMGRLMPRESRRSRMKQHHQRRLRRLLVLCESFNMSGLLVNRIAWATEAAIPVQCQFCLVVSVFSAH